MKNKSRRRRKTSRVSALSKIILILALSWLALTYGKSITDRTVSDSKSAAEVKQMVQYNFIRDIAPLAQKTQQEYNILASVTIAQACLESNFGQSTLASEYHNLFGVKASGDVPTVTLDTQEYENDRWVTIQGQFRVYKSYQAAVEAHSKLFVEGTTWNPNQYASVLTASDYTSAAKAIQTSGYATDPTYADKLIEMIETYQLENYDKVNPSA